MSDNKVVKNIVEAGTLVGLSAGVGWVAKKALKENFLNDPSSNVMNYVKWTATLTGAVFLRDYLINKKLIPENV